VHGMPVGEQGERSSVAETGDEVHHREVAVVAVGQCAVLEGVAEAPRVFIQIDIVSGEPVLPLFLAEPSDHKPPCLRFCK